MTHLSAIERECFDDEIASKLQNDTQSMPRILILYGSVRQRSYSRFAAEEAGRLAKGNKALKEIDEHRNEYSEKDL